MHPPGVNAQSFLGDTVFFAAFEGGRRRRDLSFGKRRHFFSDHSLDFGFGPCSTLGHSQTAKQHH